MPRPSVYRVVEALNHSRMTSTLPDSRVKAGERWLRLADAARSSLHEWSASRAVLDDLCRESGQTSYLTVPRGDRAICIDWSQGRAISVLALKPGGSLPLYAGAAGRVTLAFRKEDPESYLEGAPFTALTPRTLTTAAALRRDVELTRSRGYAVSDEDVTEGVGALGIPLLDRTGQLRGTLSLAGIAEDVRSRQSELVALLESAGHILAAGLG